MHGRRRSGAEKHAVGHAALARERETAPLILIRAQGLGAWSCGLRPPECYSIVRAIGALVHLDLAQQCAGFPFEAEQLAHMELTGLPARLD